MSEVRTYRVIGTGRLFTELSPRGGGNFQGREVGPDWILGLLEYTATEARHARNAERHHLQVVRRDKLVPVGQDRAGAPAMRKAA